MSGSDVFSVKQMPWESSLSVAVLNDGVCMWGGGGGQVLLYVLLMVCVCVCVCLLYI